MVVSTEAPFPMFRRPPTTLLHKLLSVHQFPAEAAVSFFFTTYSLEGPPFSDSNHDWLVQVCVADSSHDVVY